MPQTSAAAGHARAGGTRAGTGCPETRIPVRIPHLPALREPDSDPPAAAAHPLQAAVSGLRDATGRRHHHHRAAADYRRDHHQLPHLQLRHGGGVADRQRPGERRRPPPPAGGQSGAAAGSAGLLRRSVRGEAVQPLGDDPGGADGRRRSRVPGSSGRDAGDGAAARPSGAVPAGRRAGIRLGTRAVTPTGEARH